MSGGPAQIECVDVGICDANAAVRVGQEIVAFNVGPFVAAQIVVLVSQWHQISMAIAAEKAGRPLLVMPDLYGLIRSSVVRQKVRRAAIWRRPLRPPVCVVLPVAALPRPIRAAAIKIARPCIVGKARQRQPSQGLTFSLSRPLLRPIVSGHLKGLSLFSKMAASPVFVLAQKALGEGGRQ